MPFVPLLAATLSLGRIFPTDLGSPNNRLVYAARMGDLQAVRACFLDYKIANLDLDSALDAAAAYAHLSVVELLIAFGASDLNSALLSAAARDHVKVVQYLISEKRQNPATNTRDAQTLAANVGAINCDWLLTAHFWNDLRSSYYPKASVQKWEQGSILDVRNAVGQHDLTQSFVSTLHSTEGTHVDAPHKSRPGWVGVLTSQVSYYYVPTPIATLRCSPATRGEDSVILRTFFFTPEGMPLLGPGIYVETGAADGLEQSTTLFFEKCLGWAGVLIEPHPVVWQKLLRAPRSHAIKRNAAICEHNGTTRIDARAWTAATTIDLNPTLPSLRVPCAPLSQLLSRVNAVRRTGRVDFLSLDVEGAEPIAAATLGDEISYGVVMAEVTAGARRAATMMTMLARGFAYVGQISARPSPTNYVISDVWYNRSHFQRYWPKSRVLFV